MQTSSFMRGFAWFLAAAPLPSLAQSATIGCGSVPSTESAWVVDKAVLFQKRITNVDADGAPNAYLVNGDGLSFTCDGVVAIENGKRVTPTSDPDGWQAKCRSAWATAVQTGDYSKVAIFGFQVDARGRPLVQGDGDPLPGRAFISATTARIPSAPPRTQRQYVDATAIPYFVAPSSFVKAHGLKDGTIAAVYRPRTNRIAFAVFADSGGLGEASIKLHRDLGNEPTTLRDGVARAKRRIEDPVLTVVFPAVVVPPQADAAAWYEKIRSEGSAALSAFGGADRLAACLRR